VECTWHKLYYYYYYFWFLSSIGLFVHNETRSADQLIVTLVNETVNWLVCSADIYCCTELVLRHFQRYKLYGLGPDLLVQQ
jgi:hypothetical protein